MNGNKQTWDLWAVLYPDGLFHNVGNEFYASAYAMDDEQAVPVVVTVDADGTYFGWSDGMDDHPVLIQPHLDMFNMQFHYGAEAEVKSGKGEILKLVIEPKAEKLVIESKELPMDLTPKSEKIITENR